ncbi:hypothetical protein M569_14776 [Genlisea aurea]|uniref:Protein kinase domain-containing protein n=1 Tax=Genlisea aurea TaxID=192259 RepID=S8C6H9_9LAMI|nr:hypothetical protein M569_14776 [Genlisea aurea]
MTVIHLAAVLLRLLPLSLAFCSAPAPAPETVCPPFTSPPPFPFSASPGCGHPSFQIQCSPPSPAVISVNDLSFSILRVDPNSTSLTLSPALTQGAVSESAPPKCRPSAETLAFLDGSPISFSGSPFRVSDSACSRLSALRPCPRRNLTNCTSCSLECDLIENPLHLIADCGEFSARRREDYRPECRTDVLGVLDGMLRIGFEVEWDEDRRDPYFSGCRSCDGSCGYNSSDSRKQFICFPARSRIRRVGPINVAVFSISFLLLCILLTAIFLVVVVFRSRIKATDEDPTIAFLRRHRASSLLPPLFTYEELDSSTNHFDPRRKIGDGGFGSVYLAQLPDGSSVAVKYLHRNSSAAETARKKFSDNSFCNEILILSSLRHPNLVKLHGYCCDPRGLLLVYDYVPNGTLADHIHGHRKGSLRWPTRLDIAFQTAAALEYLHFSVVPSVVHRDITSSNIFVGKDMAVKLGDFGLSRLLVFPEAAGGGSIRTGPQGTPGYLDPDYHQSFMLNEKSDIYSFGVVLFELITGLKAVDRSREKREVGLVDMAVPRIQMGLLHQLVDRELAGDGEEVNAVAELAFRCVAACKDDRPDAREVAAELGRIRGSCCRGGAGVCDI